MKYYLPMIEDLGFYIVVENETYDYLICDQCLYNY